MKIDILTLFPEMMEAALKTSIIGRAEENGLLSINCVQIRDFAFNKHRQVDDYPYGGGQGMVMQAEPIFQAYKSVTEGLDYKPKTIYMSPQGKTFRQSTAKRLAKEKHIVLLCGHYEGVDQRVLDTCVDEEISIGDYILTGGELAAMVLTDAVARFIPGVLGSADSPEEESFSDGLLEYPQYTRPRIWNGMEVPEVLLNGDHARIREWRRRESLKATLRFRPDLLSSAPLTSGDLAVLEELRTEAEPE